MAITYTEDFSHARDQLPNAYGVGTANAVTAREIDFVTRFGQNWDALREILGIMNPVRKTPGTQLVSYVASVTLESGAVDPGKVIPYSKASVLQYAKADLSLLKYAKAVPIEDVNKYGAAIAVQKTDDAFLNELQAQVLDGFYTFLADDTNAMTGTYSTFQMGVAMAIGKVRDKFKTMRKNITDVVVFVNTLDAYQYLGAAEVSIQSAFGIDYIQNFMGARTVILSSEIDQGTVIAIPSDNIVLYYVDPGDGEFAQLGLNYTVQGETNLIGFHANGNYSTAVGESFALMGMALWMEYADGVAVITVDPDADPEGATGATGTTE